MTYREWMSKARFEYWRSLWDKTQHVEAAAIRAGVHRSFAYKILVDLGIKEPKKITGNAEYRSLAR